MEWQKRTDQTLENQAETWYTKMQSAMSGEYIHFTILIIASPHAIVKFIGLWCHAFPGWLNAGMYRFMP